MKKTMKEKMRKICVGALGGIMALTVIGCGSERADETAAEIVEQTADVDGEEELVDVEAETSEVAEENAVDEVETQESASDEPGYEIGSEELNALVEQYAYTLSVANDGEEVSYFGWNMPDGWEAGFREENQGSLHLENATDDIMEPYLFIYSIYKGILQVSEDSDYYWLATITGNEDNAWNAFYQTGVWEEAELPLYCERDAVGQDHAVLVDKVGEMETPFGTGILYCAVTAGIYWGGADVGEDGELYEIEGVDSVYDKEGVLLAIGNRLVRIEYTQYREYYLTEYYLGEGELKDISYLDTLELQEYTGTIEELVTQMLE